MALCHFSSSLTFKNLCCPFTPFPKLSSSHLKWKSQQNPLLSNPMFSCSAEKTSKKGRASRHTRSNEELCGELREFISMAGLPDDRVPSIKDLSEHGRKDLANIVRRRGYRVITELLRNSYKKVTCTDKYSHGNHNNSNACKDEAPEDQERNLNEFADSVSFSSDSSLVENCMLIENGSIVTDIVREPLESSIEPQIVKAGDFIHTGMLDIAEESSIEPQIVKARDFIHTGMLDIAEASVDSRNTSHYSAEWHPDKDATAVGDERKNADVEADLAPEDAERDNRIEIDRLKTVLHKNKMELSLLKQQLEKEKQALSILQARANSEIDNIHRTISAKEMELRAAEENLSGLTEIQIEYWANGEKVEVAGSFNGWHHQIKMDLHSSSNVINPAGSRLWSTVLWLYPGIYEIKFIVDGHWRIDSQREVITNGSITNNIVRVER